MFGTIATLFSLFLIVAIIALPWHVSTKIIHGLIAMAVFAVASAGYILLIPFVLIIAAVEHLFFMQKSPFRVGWRNLKDLLG